MGMMQEFREFAVKGNAIDLAVGVIIGGAFGKIVSSFVGDVVMPPLGKAIGGVSFTNLGTSLGTGADGNEVILKWGAFLQTMFDFLIIALVLFMALRAINSLKKPDPAAPPPPPPANELLLAEIRDLLRQRS